MLELVNFLGVDANRYASLAKLLHRDPGIMSFAIVYPPQRQNYSNPRKLETS